MSDKYFDRSRLALAWFCQTKVWTPKNAYYNINITMKTLRDYPIQELKVIYNILHAQFPRHTELMDSELLQDLQNDLRQRAEASGVDVGKTADWANWLTHK